MNVTIQKQQIGDRQINTNIFSKVMYKTSFSNKKDSQFLFSVDILKDDVRKELLLITIKRLEELYLTINSKPNPSYFIQKKGKMLFFECLKRVCDDFLTKNYGCNIRVNATSLKTCLYTKNLLRDNDILFKVPLYSLMDPNSPNFRSIFYPIYNSASNSFIEALIDNLVLEISNCVVYFSLVKFSSVYKFRQILYRSKFLSLRNLERFRNNLNWQIYTQNYIQRPIDLYNNRYGISILKTSGIYCRVIYANRVKEIASLKNLPLATIVLVEVSDFFISRFEETLFVVSKSARFVLTSVLGQVIGLIWRGVIEGLKK